MSEKSLEEVARFIFENTSTATPDFSKPQKVMEIAALTLEAVVPVLDLFANKIPAMRQNYWKESFFWLLIADGLRSDPIRRYREWPLPNNCYDYALGFLFDFASFPPQISNILAANNLPSDTFSPQEIKRLKNAAEICTHVANLLRYRPKDEIPFDFASFQKDLT